LLLLLLLLLRHSPRSVSSSPEYRTPNPPLGYSESA